MTAMVDIKRAALAAHRAGLCVLPPREDGSKRPLGNEWATYQARSSTLAEIKEWYTNAREGIGAVTGKVSNNLEVFEFDDPVVYERFVALARASGLGEIVDRIMAGYEEETPGEGIHWPMFCDEIAGNTTLARRPGDDGKTDTLIQTRGEGGYIVLAPSGGRVHPTGKSYRLRGGTFATIARVTPDERRALWHLARSFDEMPVRDISTPSSPPRPPDTGPRPGEDFVARTDWAAILEPHGWVRVFARGEVTHWRRPGKEYGISATTNYAGSELLYVFSSSTVFDPERGYNKFGAYAILNHNGDFAAAASELARQGYGEQRPPSIARLRRTREDTTAQQESGDETVNPNDYPLTDRGNAQLFAARCADELRYDYRRGVWLRWTGHWWRRDDNGHVMRIAGRVSEWRINAADEIQDERDRKAAYRWAQQSQSRARLMAILDIGQAVEPLAVAGDEWDSDLYKMGVANGVIDLRSGALLPGDPAETITMHSPVAFDPNATAPRWLRFLDEVFRGDAELIAYVRRFAGYSLTGDTRESKLLICWGEGANGKSTLLSALAYAAGDYGYAMPFSTIEAQRNPGGPTNDLAALVGRRIVISSEVNEGQPLNEARIKALTGGDPITARFLNKEFFTFQPAAKFWLGVNHKPRVRDESKGFWRRIALLPFLASFQGAQEDQQLKETLRRESPGILTWMVQGCLEWQRQGLGTPAAIGAATEEYARESDPLADFFVEACVIGNQQIVRGNVLYHAYIDWANDQGIRDKDHLGHQRFGQLVGAKFEKARDRQGVTYRGIGLSIEWQDRKRAPNGRGSV